MGKWTKQQILDRIRNGECPSELGRRGAFKAHKIQDVFRNVGPGLYCKTSSHGWHPATPREREVLKRKGNGTSVKQHAPESQQLVLNF